MGYDINQFRGVEVSEEFICLICTDVLKDPVQGKCEHAFCSECIRKWLSQTDSSNTCPADRQVLRRAMLKPVPRYFKSLLEKLVISCKYADSGCKFTVPLEKYAELEDHDLICEFHPPVKCNVFGGCGLIIKRQQIQSHRCIDHLRNEYQRMKDEIEEEKMQHFFEVENLEEGLLLQINERDVHIKVQNSKITSLNEQINQRDTSNKVQNSKITSPNEKVDQRDALKAQALKIASLNEQVNQRDMSIKVANSRVALRNEEVNQRDALIKVQRSKIEGMNKRVSELCKIHSDQVKELLNANEKISEIAATMKDRYGKN